MGDALSVPFIVSWSLDLTVNETSFQGPFLILEGGREKDSVKKVAANDEL